MATVVPTAALFGFESTITTNTCFPVVGHDDLGLAAAASGRVEPKSSNITKARGHDRFKRIETAALNLSLFWFKRITYSYFGRASTWAIGSHGKAAKDRKCYKVKQCVTN